MTPDERRVLLNTSRDAMEAETERAWDWVYSLPTNHPGQVLAIRVLGGLPYTPLIVEDLWAMIAVAIEDKDLPKPPVE